jgi:outer membrane protein assembly factor BamB
MTPIRRFSLLALLTAAAISAAGCSTMSRLNPFDGGDDSPKETAAEGERIPIIAFDQSVNPADALKGQDFFLPTPATQAEWPLPGGVPEQAVGHVDAPATLNVAWKHDFGEGSNRGYQVTAPPVEAAGRVYVMDGAATVTAFDSRTGADVWRTNLRPEGKRDKESFGGGLAFADGKLYVTSGYRFVAQLDAATGKLNWRTTTESPIRAAPTVAGGRVLAVATDNTLLTYETATGTPSWTYQALTEPARIIGASSPAVSGETVVAAFGSGELVALRLANGNDLWNEALSRASRTNALSEIRDIPGRPVIYMGDVYAVSHSGVFAATDLRTGQARWSLPVTGISTPWPAGDVVYVVSKAGEVICVARESGQVYWIRDLNAGIKVKKGGKWYTLGMGGGRKVRPVWSSPLLASNHLILGSSDGELISLNAKTGEVVKRIDAGGGVLMAPIAAGGTVYVVTDEATLIALR